MNWALVIIGCNLLLILLQSIILFRSVKSGNGFSYLLAICGFFWGFLFYFFFGFPLDEGTCQEKEIPVFEIGFGTSAGLVGISVLSVFLNFFRNKRS
ncbi:MAG: hypothetical protein ACO1N0_04895 [Fluviicola sp.]